MCVGGGWEFVGVVCGEGEGGWMWVWLGGYGGVGVGAHAHAHVLEEKSLLSLPSCIIVLAQSGT